MGLDEAGTARTLREHRTVIDSIVARHGGRLVKTMGDGVLLEIPSVVDAVECAVAVQAVMAQRNEGVSAARRMLFTIGINLGDILIEGDDILGDGVNVAARLEGIAEPGGICISSSAYEQVRGKVPVEFTDIGEQVLKNIARPIRAYVVGRSADAGQTAPLPLSAPHLSLVVLPFANIGGDPEQEYFVDGVTESLRPFPMVSPCVWPAPVMTATIPFNRMTDSGDIQKRPLDYAAYNSIGTSNPLS